MEHSQKPLLEEDYDGENEGVFRTCVTACSATEIKKVSSVALPMMVVTVSQYLLRISPLFMLGHLGELPLSSASITTSLANVSGYSIIVRTILFYMLVQ